MKPARNSGTARPRRKPAAAPESAAAALTVSRPELLVDGSDFVFRRLVHSLLAFCARHEAVRDGHGAVIGLAGVEYTVLISINHLSHQGDVSVRTVADHLHLSGAFVTTVTNKLAQQGLVAKDENPIDRRRVRLSVTASGRDLLRRLAPRQRQVNDIQFGTLDSDEFHELLRLVDKVVASSEQAVAFQRYLAETADVQPAATGDVLPARRRAGAK
ncbi:MarR family transcriptional regulator [Rhodovarius crocodyli]|uniref:MarR family transcriptional regulator n=1 Tax=Rhodovarius crocodyli TaxID=1979269 RepID=A0A437M326_9PROT|nr:MarR family winged helix-turn-helix transcriptional regulator [Rhodovarius crocodyli]RVT91986.1 MarR family transcriptional regulator [Rhodovarius crocodyli]